MKKLPVANTILEQLGGRKFVVMTGAKNPVGSENSLSFRLPKAAKSINAVKITLDPSDTYSVEFGRVHGGVYRVIEKHSDIYCDQLVSLFEQTTKLVTRLF